MLTWIKKLFSKKIEDKMGDKPSWLLIAEKEIGIKEVKGGENPRIIEYHQATDLKATEDEISWCAAFVNWCLIQSGNLGTHRANARSFLKWGIETNTPHLGDIVVFWRGDKDGWQGHVAFYVGENKNFIKVLGGNQSDKVCYAEYSKTQLLAYRKLMK